jgi:hypothetical protein
MAIATPALSLGTFRYRPMPTEFFTLLAANPITSQCAPCVGTRELLVAATLGCFVPRDARHSPLLADLGMGTVDSMGGKLETGPGPQAKQLNVYLPRYIPHDHTPLLSPLFHSCHGVHDSQGCRHWGETPGVVPTWSASAAALTMAGGEMPLNKKDYISVRVN